MARRQNLAAMGFLAMAFVVVGLVGLFASFAAPLPLQRALARDAALDAALAALEAPDPQAALRALTPRLGDSAPALGKAAPADLPAAIRAERSAMHARLSAEADEVGHRLRWLIVLITLTAAGFGVAMMGAGRGTVPEA